MDSWKLPIFERHLKQHGYSFERSELSADGLIILGVVTDNIEALAEVVSAANYEAAMTGEYK